MTDLDQLLRDTLHGRAATVVDGPPFPQPADQPRARSRSLLVAATVALVLMTGGGLTAWELGRTRAGDPAGGGYATTCAVTPPAAWRAAFTATPIAVDGQPTSVRELTSYGDLVDWLDSDGSEHLGVRTPSGHVHSLDAVLRGRRLSGTAVDGATLVLSIAPSATKQIPDALVNDIVAVDLHTFAVRDVLRAARQPRGTVVADKAAAVLDGTVYWVSVRGTEDPSSVSAQGTVLAFSLRTGRTRLVGHAPGLLTWDDPRGVYWRGGGVSHGLVPSSVPPVRDGAGRYNPAVSDGDAFAWIRATQPTVVGWADRVGDERRWRIASSPSFVNPLAVSGPFVFLQLDSVRPDVFVLDTRSGALTDSGLQSLGGATTNGTRVTLAARDKSNGSLLSVGLDTTHLPELHC